MKTIKDELNEWAIKLAFAEKASETFIYYSDEYIPSENYCELIEEKTINGLSFKAYRHKSIWAVIIILPEFFRRYILVGLLGCRECCDLAERLHYIDHITLTGTGSKLERLIKETITDEIEFPLLYARDGSEIKSAKGVLDE